MGGEKWAVGLPKGDADLKRFVDTTIAELLPTGRLTALMKYWLKKASDF